MSRIAFTLEIEPMSLQFSGKRMRFVEKTTLKRIGGKTVPTKRPLPMFFRSKEAEQYRRRVLKLCAPFCPPSALAGPLRLIVTFVVPRAQRLNTGTFPPGRILHDKRLDTTNLVKALEDILTEAGFWHDDGQIAKHVLEKYYAARTGTPCIEVAVEKLSPDLHTQGTFL